MSSPRTGRKPLPPVVHRYLVPALLLLILIALLTIITIIVLSSAGLTPGA